MAARRSQARAAQPPAKFPASFGPDIEVEEVDLNETEVIVGGERLTEERAEEYADRFERSSNLVPGGKSLSGGSKHSPVVQVRVPEDVRRQLEEHAHSAGVGVSKVVRKAIDEYLANHVRA